MYAFLSSTVKRLQPVQTNSVMCGSKRFFISEKPELQLTVRFFCGSVQFSCSFFWLREPDFQTLFLFREYVKEFVKLFWDLFFHSKNFFFEVDFCLYGCHGGQLGVNPCAVFHVTSYGGDIRKNTFAPRSV